jgi:hypothetical protein
MLLSQGFGQLHYLAKVRTNKLTLIIFHNFFSLLLSPCLESLDTLDIVDEVDFSLSPGLPLRCLFHDFHLGTSQEFSFLNTQQVPTSHPPSKLS